MRRTIKRVAAFTLATVLAVSTLTIGDVTTVNAASAKVHVITAEKNNGGDSIKYTYNKKGLVSKIVSKNSHKTKDTDVSETVTTTYKYNKKNKIAKKTAKSVTKTKYYETDKTTNLKIVGTEGTVTDTVTTATTYKYNKKGLATSSVTTTTYGKSGSTRTKSKSSLVNAYDDDATELSDGRVIAGYNYYKSDGTSYNNDTEKAQSAYYYSGNLALTDGTTDTTTTYVNKGNGTYIETETITTNRAGYKEEPVRTYYERAGNGSVVELKKGDFTDADGKHYTYQRPDGTYTDDDDFYITQQVNIVQDPTSSSTNKSVSTTEVNSKTVTTTKYSYDKKKRVKKAVATTVSSNNESGSRSSSSNRTYIGGNGGNVTDLSSSTNKNKSTYENTSVTTTTYAYDKKGRAKKTVSTNAGKENSKSVYASMEAENSSETTTTYKNGTTATTKTSRSENTYPTTNTITVVNGVQTTTVTYNPFTETYTNSSSNSGSGSSNYSREGKKETVTYANGGRKITDTYTVTSTGGGTTTGTKIEYRFDEKGKLGGEVSTYKTTNSTGETYDGSSASYWEENGGTIDDVAAATLKINAAKGALEASGTPFNKSKTKTVLARPWKATTTYSYDKKGNVKAETTNGTRTEVVNVRNETYNNTIYEFDANGELQPKQKAVTHKYTSKDTYENTVKNGTNRLTKVLSMNKYTQDRTKSNAYNLSGRVTYTVKSKKSSVAKLAKKQQWILQNGRLNGEIGLD